jgi:hypothetical protein
MHFCQCFESKYQLLHTLIVSVLSQKYTFLYTLFVSVLSQKYQFTNFFSVNNLTILASVSEVDACMKGHILPRPVCLAQALR